VTWIISFLFHIEGYGGVVVTRRDTETWIFGSYYCIAGYCDSVVMFPHAGT
jgi:hypothetical protein